ncbi:MAG: phage tail tape measure protein [Spirochaetaceae bacterium]|nr:phage tail tape measure protein [Spirochaetaceae bacterium]
MAGKYAIETVFSLIDNITRPLSNVNNEAKVVNRPLKNMYAGAEKAADRFMGKIKNLGGKLAGALGLAGIINIDKVAGVLTSGVTNAIAYQSALAKIGTVADTAAVPIGNLSKEILEVSSRTGIASNQIADSMYTAITAGISTEKASAFVETATKSAIGGFTDEATAIDALTSVINAYGLRAEHAAAISDRMLLTQNLGKTSFNDMAQAMGKVVPYAAHLGVSVDELFASIASLTGSGSLKTADAMSSMKAMLASVINPSKEAAETAKRLGVDFSASALQAKGFAKFIQEISDAAGGNQIVLGKLFGSDKADTAVRILTSSGRDSFLGALDAMRNSAGATEEAFAKMMNTPEKRWAMVTNTVRNAGINLGNALLPAIEKIAEKIGGIAGSIAKIDFSKYTGAVEKAFGVIGFFIDAITGAVKTAWQFRGVIIAVVIAMGLYYAVSMAVVGVGKLIIANLLAIS